MPFYRRFTKYIKQLFFRGEERDVKWTKTHGFFIQMGGFMLYKNGQPVEVLTYQSLKERIEEEEIDIPRITERTINDKSKSDYLSKGFVVVQTTWFVVQCIARLAKSLPLAELEVFTLAFAVLNAITYAIWFDKPQNVQEGVRVDLKPTSLNPPNSLKPLSAEFQLPEQPHSILSWWHSPVLPEVPHHLRRTWSGLLWFITYRIPCCVVVSTNRLIVSAGHLLEKLLSSISIVREGTFMRVPMFGFDYLTGISLVLALYLPSLIGVTYGLLHVIAWHSGPTEFERQLWRYSTLIITIDPLLLAFTLYVTEPETSVPLRLKVCFRSIGSFLYIPFMLVYVIARVALIAQALASLRQLAPATFCDVDWISFIPHF
jgi:hypothetical protein